MALRIFTPFLFMLLAATGSGQHADLIIYSVGGEKFSVTIDGKRYNEVPSTRIEATGIRNETPMIMIDLLDETDGEVKNIRKGGYFPLGREYTIILKKNKKGVYVLRPGGEAELGTNTTVAIVSDQAVDAEEEVGQPADRVFRRELQQEQTEEPGEVIGSDKVDVSIQMNGTAMDVQMQVQEEHSDFIGTTTITTTTTTTTVIQDVNTMDDVMQVNNDPVITDDGCAYIMTNTEFDQARQSIEEKSFEDSKLTLAKQIVRNNCMSSDQVKGVMQLFGFEDTKLDLAKFAYDFTHDRHNYYQVNDAFGFESSIEELNEYLEGR